jgi:hypothetical protein
MPISPVAAIRGVVVVNTTPSLPLHFAQSLLINVAFPLPSSSARTLLPPNTGVNLVEVFPGRAVLIVSFALYRESPFGAYGEATLALMASHEKTTPVMTLAQLMQESRYPAYVLHMLVSSPEAQQLGVEFWSLPRTLAAVDIREERGQTICTAHQDEQNVVQLVVDRPTTNRTRTAQIETYSHRDQALLRSVLRCQSQAYGRTQGGGATLMWGDHAIGQRFAGLNVSTLPLMLRYYDQVQAELHAPEPCASR